ncbi:hypothetical protein LTR85_004535 [Meristemomyces frigidus]|nr:hypothetical protein LTR85_004535 [Meristemomyces frigidus]
MAYWKTVIGKRPLGGGPSDTSFVPTKRTKLDSTDTRNRSSTPSVDIQKPTGLMDLPAELRIHIYGDLFADLVALPQHPYDDDYPLNNRFEDYCNLLLTCRQVCQEAKPLFRKQYAHHMVFYYEESSALVELVKYWPDEALLRNARFVLRARACNEGEDPRFEVNESCVMLIDEQGMHDERYDEWIERPGQWTTDDRGLRETDGFERSQIDHRSCLSSTECLVCTKLVWPRFARNNCTLTCYNWSPMGCVYPEASMVLEGKLSDLRISGCNARLARARLVEYKGEQYWTDGGSDSDFDPTDPFGMRAGMMEEMRFLPGSPGCGWSEDEVTEESSSDDDDEEDGVSVSESSSGEDDDVRADASSDASSEASDEREGS